MATLQELLSQSVTQTMGLSDILDKRRTEAIQLGQALVDQAGYQANAMTNAASIRANAQDKITAMGGDPMQDIFTAGMAVKKGWDTQTKLEQERQKLVNEQKWKQNEYDLKVAEAKAKANNQEEVFKLQKEIFELKNNGMKVHGKDEYVDPETKKTFTGLVTEQGIYDPIKQTFVAGAEKYVKPDEDNTFKTETELRKEFNQLPIVKTFYDIKSSYGRIKAAKDTPAGDIGLIYGFMKIQDPGSTVREGEYATAQNAAGIPDQVRNAYNRAIAGTRLSPAQREDFKTQAEALYGSAASQYDETANKYRGLATQYGVKENRVATLSGYVSRPLMQTKEETTQPEKKPLLTGKEPVKDYNSVADVNKANLPKGTVITIKGRRAVIE